MPGNDTYVVFCCSKKEVNAWFVLSTVGDVLNKKAWQLLSSVQGTIAVKAGRVFIVSENQDQLCSMPLKGALAKETCLFLYQLP
jgi:hypothetical protein